MQVRCSVCGQPVELPKTHKDYQRLADDPRQVFICHRCTENMQWQARQTQKATRPI